MIGLDTNVLVRYLTQDDAAQARRASAVISESTSGGARCYLSPVVYVFSPWTFTTR
jgi:predicted nucleic-acid-binding protein